MMPAWPDKFYHEEQEVSEGIQGKELLSSGVLKCESSEVRESVISNR